MNQAKVNMEEANAIRAFRAKLEMAKINRGAYSAETQKHDTFGHAVGEFDLTNLPLPVKKHIITAGIIQGDIFEFGDGFACVKEVVSKGKSANNKTLHLYIRGLGPKSYRTAIGMVELLINEVLEPQIKSKRFFHGRAWQPVLKNEFEIASLMKPVISHLITKGIIKGDIFQISGAMVNAKGNPYLADDCPQQSSQRPLYLLIQGPNDKTLYWARERIQNLIKEGEEILNNAIPKAISDSRAQSNVEVVSCDQDQDSDVVVTGVTIVGQPRQPQVNINAQNAPFMPNPNELDEDEDVVITGVTTVDEQLQPSVNTNSRFPPFMPELGQSVKADVDRCTVLVQWLLAHPLLVSFMASPPKGLESKKFTRKMVTVALLSLPLYDQYECTHSMGSKLCGNCHEFFSKAQNAAHQCCDAVANAGYDITKLMVVDDYVKLLAGDPADIGVLYDYPLPKNLFHFDSCRLFIDLSVNCGFNVSGTMIESYLRCTNEWYPVEAFKNNAVVTEVNPCPSKNTKQPHHIGRMYSSIEHQGGLINFHLRTLGCASRGQLFPADAPKIPRCRYFPFLSRLSVFSRIGNVIDTIGSGATSYRKMMKDQYLNRNLAQPQRESKGGPLWPSESSVAQPSTSGFAVAPPQAAGMRTRTPQQASDNGLREDPNASITLKRPLDKEPTKEPNEKPAPNSSPSTSSKPSRKLRKEIRKMKQEMKKEEKKQEVVKAIENLKDKHGTNNFWTVDTAELMAGNAKEKLEKLLVPQERLPGVQLGSAPQPHSMPLLMGSICPPDLQQALSQMQTSVPAVQPTFYGLQPPTLMGQRNSILKPPLLNANQVLGSQQSGGDTTPSQDGSPSVLSEVINKLQEFIQASNPKSADGNEREHSSEGADDRRPQSNTAPQGPAPASSAQPSSASEDPAQDSAFSSVIQQLHQFLDSNTQTSTEDNANDKTQPADPFKKPVQPILRKQTIDTQKTSEVVSRNREYEQQSSQMKRPSTEPSGSTQTKRLCTENSNTGKTTKSTSAAKPSISLTKPSVPVAKPSDPFAKPFIPTPKTVKTPISFSQQKPRCDKVVLVSKKQIPVYKGNAGKYPTLSSSVSILGDSLLKGARALFGGSDDHDCIHDSFTISKLRENVMKFHNQGGRLRPYCLVMCGVNDTIQSTTPKEFVQHLKNLINFLNNKGYYVMLVSLPLVISNVSQINKAIPTVNGFILSFNTKPNLSIIPFHHFFRDCKNQKGLLKSIHVETPNATAFTPVVLSDLGCETIQGMVENEFSTIRAKK